MVVPSSVALRSKKTRAYGIPVVDLSLGRSTLRELTVKACEDFGFFQVVNHGVSADIISSVEEQGRDFFSKPACEKKRAGPSNPFGYGCKNIGHNGDKGELEYLILEADSSSVVRRSETINSSDPQQFSCAVNNYIEAVRNLTCEILDLIAEGLCVHDTVPDVFSKLIRDPKSDSCFRINHYPSALTETKNDHLLDDTAACCNDEPTRIGFGEHSDPQIVTILRSNDVEGLQILSRDGLWIPIPPDTDKFCVFVGDAFEALTNGRFKSVRHRAVANSEKTRMSMMYFAAPPLDACISPPTSLTGCSPNSLYRPFTWREFKTTAFSLRLAVCRLDLFRTKLDTQHIV